MQNTFALPASTRSTTRREGKTDREQGTMSRARALAYPRMTRTGREEISHHIGGSGTPLLRTSWSAFVHPVAYRVHCATCQRQARGTGVRNTSLRKTKKIKTDMGNTLAVKGSTNKMREGRQGLGTTIHMTFSFLVNTIGINFQRKTQRRS